SDEEDREITIGATTKHRVVFVSHCQRRDRIRIISARRTTRKERKQYEEGIGA
ncbi:MAG: BrnT family toxin, partial [Deltaproteobacteria bacterium]|nr:BrnT family toxin [Deltaproteobacteria bacterium]